MDEGLPGVEWTYLGTAPPPREAFVSHATHANAAWTPRARLRLARLVVDHGWPPARAAERYDVSWRTAKKWADRWPSDSGLIASAFSLVGLALCCGSLTRSRRGLYAIGRSSMARIRVSARGAPHAWCLWGYF
jgi:hypothetical protein